jgi:hypothetical protein
MGGVQVEERQRRGLVHEREQREAAAAAEQDRLAAAAEWVPWLLLLLMARQSWPACT